MNIYIDESGNLGKQGKYFVITAVVIDKDSGGTKRLKNIVKNFVSKSDKDEIKGVDLTFPERQGVLNKLKKKKDHEIFYICLDKENLSNRSLFKEQSVLFNYLCKFLFIEILEKYSAEDIVLNIHVDQRNIKINSTHSLGDYLKTLILGDMGISSKIELNYFDSQTNKLIQVADITSGIIHNYYKSGQTHDYSNLLIGGSVHFPKEGFDR